jgi:hypothetical protein
LVFDEQFRKLLFQGGDFRTIAHLVPYGLAHILLVTPQDWSLTESSSEIRLPVAT